MAVNKATIVESEVFVYNLGTMFYIDKVLFAERESLPVTNEPEVTTPIMSTMAEVEKIPEEIFEENGTLPDVLLADVDVTTDTELIDSNDATPTMSQNDTVK